ncbi:response regulator transcription factor [Gemmata sp. JC673]|uniref:Response regulator transcription factor n=1 Tax=Gemmata algarum TaxID=2975278 RepID=A0ABU5EY23_9BACT|nr:response regulator transcription factor [Gemmata algarum]MDY3560200.1 response regulator transcription factor [Gemmata algarum]
MSKLRVLLADDHPVVRNGLRELLRAEPDMDIVGEVPNGEAAVRRSHELRPDVVVMDVSMPGMGGTEATAQIRKLCPEVHIVALTAHEDGGYLQRVVASGASGYVLKRSAAAGLIRAIREAAAGRQYLDPAVAGQPVADPGPVPSKGHEPLSERERQVLKEVALGYSNKQIAARNGVSVKTVEASKSRFMEKLGMKSRVDIVRYAAEHGWLSGV